MPALKKTKTQTKLVLPVYDRGGKESESCALPKEIFTVEAKPELLAQYVRVYQSNQRQGNAATKTRSEVTGSTRKIYRQKGTGRARHGSIKAPIFVGGGVVGGPTPRDFSLAMNKKQKRKALFSALTLKQKQGNIIGLSDELNQIEPKTKFFAEILNNLKIDKQKILLIVNDFKKNNLVFAARNLPNLTISKVELINPYLILSNQKIIFLKQSITRLTKHFLSKKNEN